jgi:hypothetical protein
MKRAPKPRRLSEPWKKPGDTYFLARSNIIGGTCLTTVFGMGTGMARCLWSPGRRAAPREHLLAQGDLTCANAGLKKR